MQLCDLALHGEQDRSGRSAGEPRLAELRFQLRRAAGKRRIDDIVERQRRGVGYDRGNIVDADLIAAAGIERELGDLVAGRLAVAAEQRDQHGARVRRELEAGFTHLVVDQPRPRSRSSSA